MALEQHSHTSAHPPTAAGLQCVIHRVHLGKVRCPSRSVPTQPQNSPNFKHPGWKTLFHAEHLSAYFPVQRFPSISLNKKPTTVDENMASRLVTGASQPNVKCYRCIKFCNQQMTSQFYYPHKQMSTHTKNIHQHPMPL